MHFRKVCPLGCGVLHDEQQTEGGDAVVVVVVEFAVVAVFASCSSSILRYLIAVLSSSFAAFVHHFRANSFDWSTPWP